MLDPEMLQRQASKLKRVDADDANTKPHTNNESSQSNLNSVLNSAFSKIFGKTKLENNDDNLSWDEEDEKVVAPQTTKASEVLANDNLTTRLKRALETYKAEHPEKFDDNDSVSDWDEISEEPAVREVEKKSSIRRLPSTPTDLSTAEIAIKQSLDNKEIFNSLFTEIPLEEKIQHEEDIDKEIADFVVIERTPNQPKKTLTEHLFGTTEYRSAEDSRRLKIVLEAKKRKAQRDEDYINLKKAIFGNLTLRIREAEDFNIFFEDTFGMEDEIKLEDHLETEEKREFARRLFWKLDSSLPLEVARKKQAEFQKEVIFNIKQYQKVNCNDLFDIFNNAVPLIEAEQQKCINQINARFDMHYGGVLSADAKEIYLKVWKVLFGPKIPSEIDVIYFNAYFNAYFSKQNAGEVNKLNDKVIKELYKDYVGAIKPFFDEFYDKYIKSIPSKNDFGRVARLGRFEDKKSYLSLYKAIYGAELPSSSTLSEFNIFFKECNEESEQVGTAEFFKIFVNVDDSMPPHEREAKQKDTLKLISDKQGIECKTFRDVYEKVHPKYRKASTDNIKAQTGVNLPAFNLSKEIKENKNIVITNDAAIDLRESLKRSM